MRVTRCSRDKNGQWESLDLDDSNPEEPKKKKKLIIERYATGDEDTYSLLYMDTVLLSVVRVYIYLFVLKREHSRFPFTRVRSHAIHLRRHVKCNGLTISLAASFSEVSRGRSYLTPAELYTPN